jgi:hypothetical protein
VLALLVTADARRLEVLANYLVKEHLGVVMGAYDIGYGSFTTSWPPSVQVPDPDAGERANYMLMLQAWRT